MVMEVLINKELTAKQQQYRNDTMVRKGSGNMADFLDEGRKSITQEQVIAIREQHPDLPEDDQYDLYGVVERGEWREPEATPEGQEEPSFMFLPDSGYKYDPIGMKYDVNSKTFQYDGAFPRMVREGVSQGFSHLLRMGAEPIARMMSGMYEEPQFSDEGTEEALSDMERVWKPNYLVQARTNPEQTFQGYGEQMGAALIGFGVDWFGSKGLVRSDKKVLKDAINPVKWKNMIGNMGRRLEQETQPSLIMAEFVNANDPLNDINAGPAVGKFLQDNGMDGLLVDYLLNSKDDRFSKGITNVVLGTMMMEVMRGAGVGGLKVSQIAYKNAAQFVKKAYKNAVDELNSITNAVPATGMGIPGTPNQTTEVFEKFYTPSKPGVLIPEHAEIENNFAKWVMEDIPRAIAAYKALPQTKKGLIIAVDDFRELDPSYVKNRAISQAVHEPSSAASKIMWKDALDTPSDKPVMLLSGGTGAGKSSGMKDVTDENVHAIFDSNLADFGKAKTKIEQALEKGFDVEIVHIWRDPLEAFSGEGGSAITRAMKFDGNGRTVPISAHVSTHIGSNKTIKELEKHYANNPKVNISVMDNSLGKHNNKWSTTDIIPDDIDADKLMIQVEQELEKALKDETISQKVYDGFKGTGLEH